MKALLVSAAALVLAAGPVEEAARYLGERQDAGGGFAEAGSRPTPGLTAWAVLALRAAGTPSDELEAARAYLVREQERLSSATDLELVLLARTALGDGAADLAARIRALAEPGGRIGPTVNSTIWGILALRAAGEAPPPGSVRYLLRQQRRGGGWSWHERAGPDSNDTAAAVQALRAAGVRGDPIRRALAYLRRFQNKDGGFELADGRGSDVQSTAWAIQAFLAAGERPGSKAYGYLHRMRRADGSFRYSARYAATPVWVTAQALLALAGKPLPLR